MGLLSVSESSEHWIDGAACSFPLTLRIHLQGCKLGSMTCMSEVCPLSSSVYVCLSACMAVCDCLFVCWSVSVGLVVCLSLSVCLSGGHDRILTNGTMAPFIQITMGHFQNQWDIFAESADCKCYRFESCLWCLDVD